MTAHYSVTDQATAVPIRSMPSHRHLPHLDLDLRLEVRARCLTGDPTFAMADVTYNVRLLRDSSRLRPGGNYLGQESTDGYDASTLSWHQPGGLPRGHVRQRLDGQLQQYRRHAMAPLPRAWWAHRNPLDDHGRQSDQNLRRGPADLTASYTGFVNGDTSASLTTLPAMTTTATPPAMSTAALMRSPPAARSMPDYTINYVMGTLTVTPAPLDDHGRRPDARSTGRRYPP